jgi:hypothetical protein
MICSNSDYVSKGIFLKRKDVVLLTRVESDPVTNQLDAFAGFAVDKINGTEVRDFKHAHELLHPAVAPEFHVIELFGANRPVVIPSAAVKAANARVQTSCGITKLSNLDP